MYRDYFVYILANKGRTLYVGVTNNLERRMYEHKHKLTPGFASRYNIDRLVHIEVFSDVNDAVRREKEIKGWGRAKKAALIESENPTWRDLSVEWFIGDPAVMTEQTGEAIVGPGKLSRIDP
jgi:putative endonuclease